MGSIEFRLHREFGIIIQDQHATPAWCCLSKSRSIGQDLIRAAALVAILQQIHTRREKLVHQQTQPRVTVRASRR